MSKLIIEMSKEYKMATVWCSRQKKIIEKRVRLWINVYRK